MIFFLILVLFIYLFSLLFFEILRVSFLKSRHVAQYVE